jgi:peptidoglycan/LPS O-acetylase OafA/YrhL
LSSVEPAHRKRSRRRRDRAEPWGVAYRNFRETRFFGTLDGLRALSIVAVIWFHTVPWDRGALLGQGNKGVTLFFAISGFLIVTLLLRGRERTGRIDLRKFWGRRMLRIFPVYYLALTLYVVLVALVERDPAARGAFFGNLPAFATFTSNWFVDLENTRVIFYFAWSLAAEEQFYLAWPLIERRGRAALAVALGALTVTQAVAIAWPAASRDVLPLRMLTSVPAAILLGVTLAHLLHAPRSFRWVWNVLGRRGSVVGAAVVTMLALTFAPAWEATGELVIAVALAALVAACVVREDNDLARVLRWRPIAWVGTVSYGMYLFHMIAVNLVRRAATAAEVSSPYVDFVGGTLLAVALATASYLTYERFFLWLKERWFATGSVAESPPSKPVTKPVVA